jgi:hypothetical protein
MLTFYALDNGRWTEKHRMNMSAPLNLDGLVLTMSPSTIHTRESQGWRQQLTIIIP